MNWALWYPVRQNINNQIKCLIIPVLTYVDLAERFDTKSNVKLGGFQSQLEASYVSSHTEELWYDETVCLCMTIYISGWK